MSVKQSSEELQQELDDILELEDQVDTVGWTDYLDDIAEDA